MHFILDTLSKDLFQWSNGPDSAWARNNKVYYMGKQQADRFLSPFELIVGKMVHLYPALHSCIPQTVMKAVTAFKARTCLLDNDWSSLKACSAIQSPLILLNHCNFNLNILLSYLYVIVGILCVAGISYIFAVYSMFLFTDLLLLFIVGHCNIGTN